MSIIADPDDFHSGNTPSGRDWAGFLQLSQQVMLVFGGCHHTDKERTMLDFWAFDTKNNLWKFLKGEINTYGEWDDSGVRDQIWSPFNYPGGRERPGMFRSPVNEQRIFLLGGYPFNSELWEYDYTLNWWKNIRLSSVNGNVEKETNATNVTVNYSKNRISARACFALWESYEGDEKAVYVFGGVGNGISLFNDMWKYLVLEDLYFKISGNGTENPGSIGNIEEEDDFSENNFPAARYSPSYWKSPANSNGTIEMYIFGGILPYLFFNDLWVFSEQLGQWKCLKNCKDFRNSSMKIDSIFTNHSFNETNIPSPRRGAYAWQMDDYSVFLFGGGCYDEFEYFFNDLWEFDVFQNNFRCVEGCGLFNETTSYSKYNSSFPNKINGRDYGVSYVNFWGEIGLYSGSTGNNDFWIYNNEEVSFCSNFSLAQDSFVCSGRGNCSNNSCTCENSENSDCSSFSCSGEKASSPYACSERGDCISPDECYCPKYINASSDCSSYSEESFTCYLISNKDVNVCNSYGNCTDLDFCECGEDAYGDLCKEFIYSARFLTGKIIYISHNIKEGYTRKYYRGFFCNYLFNNTNLGNTSQCSFVSSKSVLYLYLDDYSTIKSYDELFFFPITDTRNRTVRLIVQPKKFDENLIYIIIFLIVMACSMVLIGIVMVILVFLIYQNIRMCRELRRQNALLNLIVKPLDP